MPAMVKGLLRSKGHNEQSNNGIKIILTLMVVKLPDDVLPKAQICYFLGLRVTLSQSVGQLGTFHSLIQSVTD